MPHHALDLFRTTARRAAGVLTTVGRRAYRTATPLVRPPAPGRRRPVEDGPPAADAGERVGASVAGRAASAPSPAAVARVAHRRPIATPAAPQARTPSPDDAPGGKLPPRR